MAQATKPKIRIDNFILVRIAIGNELWFQSVESSRLNSGSECVIWGTCGHPQAGSKKINLLSIKNMNAKSCLNILLNSNTDAPSIR